MVALILERNNTDLSDDKNEQIIILCRDHLLELPPSPAVSIHFAGYTASDGYQGHALRHGLVGGSWREEQEGEDSID